MSNQAMITWYPFILNTHALVIMIVMFKNGCTSGKKTNIYNENQTALNWPVKGNRAEN